MLLRLVRLKCPRLFRSGLAVGIRFDLTVCAWGRVLRLLFSGYTATASMLVKFGEIWWVCSGFVDGLCYPLYSGDSGWVALPWLSVCS